MIDPVRQEVIALAHTLVVKVGTNVLTDDHGALNPERLADLAKQIARLVKTGRRVVLVSSGAIGAGVGAGAALILVQFGAQAPNIRLDPGSEIVLSVNPRREAARQ